MKSTVRAFIAVDISVGVRSAALKAVKPLREAFPSVKWVDADNFHLTLKFLGPNVPTAELHKLIAALERACRRVEQFDLVFEGLGAFPSPSNPRTIWIGVSDGIIELRKLAACVEEELEKLGYPPEGRGFSPHMTLGRAKSRDRGGKAPRDDEARDVLAPLARMVYDRANVFLGTSPVDAVVLYSSELERGGSKYEPLATINLAPLGSLDNEDEPFSPQRYDSDETPCETDELERSLTAPRNAKFDMNALDADVEEELRAICGDSFAEFSESRMRKSARKSFGARGEAKSSKRPKGVSHAAKAALKADDSELNDLDFSNLDELLQKDRIRPKKQFPKK